MLLEVGEENRVLDCQEIQIDVNQGLHFMKIGYLIDEKQRIEVEMHQLRQNNSLLRLINKNLDKNLNTNLQHVLKRNEQLQRALIKLSNQCSQLKTKIFLTSQVNLNNQKEQRQILKNYQSRILDLRKSMQAKQLTIQNLEETIYQKNWVGINYSRVQIFQRVQNINKMLKEFSNKNNKLTAENQKMKTQNKKMAEKIQKMQRLLTSKCSYLEYKNLLTESRLQSTPKSKIHLEFKSEQRESIRTRYNPQSTCEEKRTRHKLINSSGSLSEVMETSHTSSSQAAILKNIAKMKCQEVRKLAMKVTNQEYRIAKLTEQNKALIQSNKIYQNSRRTEKQKANQYESLFKTLFNYLTQRNSSLPSSVQYADDSFKQNYLAKKYASKLQKQAKQHRNSPEEWMCMKNFLDQRLCYASYPQKKSRTRSYSCVLDYIHNKEVKQDNQLGKQRQPQEQFSMMLQDFKVGENSIRMVGGGRSQKRIQKSKNQLPEEEVDQFLDALDDI